MGGDAQNHRTGMVMSLKAIVTDIDEVPEDVRGLYVEQDGKHVLNVEPVEGFALEDVSGLKHVLSTERSQRERMRAELEKFGSTYDTEQQKWVHSFEPKKAREALAKLEEFESIDPNKEADKIAQKKIEARERQLLEKHSAELQAIKDREGQLTRTVESLLVDQVATSALAEAKGSVDLLLPHVQRSTRVREVDGKFKVEVVDADGNARIANGKADPMTIKDLIAEMKASDTFGRAFEASGQSGSGMQPGAGGHNGSGAKKGNFGGTIEDRKAAIAARFPDLPRAG